MLALSEIAAKLSKRKQLYHDKYGVTRMGIFGSYSRGDQSNSSDIDIVVEFDRPIGLAFVDLADDLERVLQTKVDLVSRKAIKPKRLEVLESEIVYV
jgi:hypothetical protein